jgi:hypothetical protein
MFYAFNVVEYYSYSSGLATMIDEVAVQRSMSATIGKEKG